MRDVQLLGKLLESGLLGLVNHDLHHLLADELALRALGVASSADLATGPLGEADAEHAEKVAVEGLGLDEGLNGGVPLLDDGAELVAGDVHAVEVGVAVEALDLLDLDLHLSPSLLVGVSVQISQRYLEHAALQAVRGDLYANYAGNLLLWPAVLLQGVMVGVRTSNTVGTWTLYHSFFWKGWALKRE